MAEKHRDVIFLGIGLGLALRTINVGLLFKSRPKFIILKI